MKNPKIIIGIGLIIAFSAFAFYSFSSTLNPYVTFAEAAKKSGTVQVSGFLVDDQITYELESRKLHFYLEDEEGTKVLVNYHGAKPDNMEHAESVVVIGNFNGDIFEANRLLVKCPSKYEEEK